MEEGQRVNPRDLPILAGMTTGELEDMLKRVNSDILYDDGLDKLPQMALTLLEMNSLAHEFLGRDLAGEGQPSPAYQFLEVLTSIADRASEVREGLKLVGESMKLIADALGRLVEIEDARNNRQVSDRAHHLVEGRDL